MAEADTKLLRGVDRAVFASALVAALRRAGLSASVHSGNRLAEALAAIEPTSRTELYWLSRVTLVNDVNDIAVFDRVFDVVFEGGALPTGRDARKSTPLVEPPPPDESVMQRLPKATEGADTAGGVPWSSAPSVSMDDDAPQESSIVLPEYLPSELAELADRPFDDLSETELADIGKWLETVILAWPVRPTRRSERSRHRGQLDLRRTLAGARRSGGEPVRLERVRALRRPRRVAMIADVSASMQAFARPYLHVMRALAVRTEAEVFAFSTSLTRLTPALARRDPGEAITVASELVDDRFSGTRIATSLQELMTHPTWSSSVRGAVVLVASDGWDTDPPELLSTRVARLSRMAERVVWINPRAAAEGFEPLVGGMAAALPHCDVMLSGHSLIAIRDVLEAMVSRAPANC